MRNLVQRRFTLDGMRRYFGDVQSDGASPLADRLIQHSGGHFRDLSRLLRESRGPDWMFHVEHLFSVLMVPGVPSGTGRRHILDCMARDTQRCRSMPASRARPGMRVMTRWRSAGLTCGLSIPVQRIGTLPLAAGAAAGGQVLPPHAPERGAGSPGGVQRIGSLRCRGCLGGATQRIRAAVRVRSLCSSP